MITIRSLLFHLPLLAVASSFDEPSRNVSSSPAIQEIQETHCTVGDIACCNSVHDTKESGLLSGLLGEGLLHTLIGTSDSPCAKVSLIDELGILSLIKETENGPVCKNIIACCPAGTQKCVAIDASGSGKDKQQE
ncbi:hypothetical protein FE257_002705 [Aspergillus nanangensis]|uniref:Hydrophobin n=1 Tax=Aspergillus nanangensis TaxID=2582783 RepID=A0AAD4CDQ9_ASPNN|nr:hypothetical protein FE257_002705 [Aspergillus nanangensis]